MLINNLQLNILVNGSRVSEFQSPMDFQTYIEGRDGSEFEIEISNQNGHDVEAIISIDGLSIIDGKPAGSASAGYLVRARETMRIPGWKVDGQTAAKFQFSGSKGGSYVEKIGGEALNKGVIGMKAFAPRHKPSPVFRSMGMNANSRIPSFSKGLGSRGMSPLGGSYTASSFGASSIQCSASNAVTSSVSGTLVGNSIDAAPVEQTLGTDFGAATEFKTVEVQFERGDLLAMVEVFYDDRQGLKRRGIDVSRTNTRPSAFPADNQGCQPPSDWNR